MRCGWPQTSLRSRGTKHNGVFGADEYFVLDAHAGAVRVLRELIGRDVYVYRQYQRQNAADANRQFTHTELESDNHRPKSGHFLPIPARDACSSRWHARSSPLPSNSRSHRDLSHLDIGVSGAPFGNGERLL